MKKNKKNIPGIKGFTVIEILVIVIIIGILVSVVLVTMISGREKAQNNSAFTTFKGIGSSVYMCLINSVAGTRINTPNFSGNNNICSNAAFSDAVWPVLAKTGWSYSNFSWCNPLYNNAVPPASCGAYDEDSGTCGANVISGEFCFMMKKDTKYMWCTLEGCRKNF